MPDLGIDGLGIATMVGSGGSSSVYSAIRTTVGDVVAVKLLHQGLVDSSAQIFEHEAEALKRLGAEKGIVSVLDSGVTDRGQPYLLMPFFPAGSAQDRITSAGPMPWGEAVRVVLAAAEAVERAHRRGVWHRDIKPANLLLTESNEVFVADFGIAKLFDSSQSTSVGLSATPAYSSPEALDGEFEAASDTYSLAATFHSLVVGHPPFETLPEVGGTIWSTIQRIKTENAPSLQGHGVPVELDGIIASALAKDPPERPSSAGEFASLLQGGSTTVTSRNR